MSKQTHEGKDEPNIISYGKRSGHLNPHIRTQ